MLFHDDVSRKMTTTRDSLVVGGRGEAAVRCESTQTPTSERPRLANRRLGLLDRGLGLPDRRLCLANRRLCLPNRRLCLATPRL